MPPDNAPSQDELLAMAYADGELDEASRLAFEARLSTEPDLAREVAEYQSLAILARGAAPPEPMDYEWQRLAEDPIQRAGNGAGWALVVTGVLGLSGWATVAILRSEQLETLPKMLVLGLMGGMVALFLTTAHARIRTLPFDRYKGVER